MAVPQNKEELQNAIKVNYEKLQKELVTIPEELTSISNLQGHSKGSLISIQNLVAYVLGWGELVLKWNRRKDHNLPDEFPETGFKWNQLGMLAQKFYEDYKDEDYQTLLEKLDENVNKLLVLTDLKTNGQLYEVLWYGKWTLGRMIQFNTSSPYANARGRIRKWKKDQHLK